MDALALQQLFEIVLKIDKGYVDSIVFFRDSNEVDYADGATEVEVLVRDRKGKARFFVRSLIDGKEWEETV